ncbi:MAG: branched-chain amino acid ABC transporter permease [Actinobacteria bacterium]|nr:branched-chain amino acid ABC transporter permease [Actinomycetota bacterium]
MALTMFGLLASPVQAADITIKVRVQNQVKDEATGKSTKEPIAGVKVVVTGADGVVVAEGVTDDTGLAAIVVPAKADYTVTLDESTLPDGFVLADGESERAVTEDNFVTDSVTLNFFTGNAERTSIGYWSQLAQRLADGARFGLILAMCAVGLSLIFGTTGLTNFAHGELVTFAALIAFVLNNERGWSLLVAAPLAIVAGGMFGLVTNEAVYAPLRRRQIGLISQMVVSVGIAIILKNVYLAYFGGRVKAYAAFNRQTCTELGPVCVTPRDLTTAAISLLLLVLVGVALQKTRIGKATRAVSDNSELASSTGIDSQKIIRIVWFVGGMLAATGGIFRGLDEGVSPFLGANLLFLMFAGITLGGLGSAFGALVGSFLIGLFVEASTLGMPIMPGADWPAPFDWLHDGVPSELKAAPVYVVMIIVLLVRPQGILGRRERVG